MKDSTPTTPTAPPPTTTTTTTTTASPTSPTTNKEKTTTTTPNTIFRDTRAELAQFLKKKEEIEVCEDDFSFKIKSYFQKSLSDIEEQIYAFETSYLKQTQDTGNCIRGWSNCLTSGSGSNKYVFIDRITREPEVFFSLKNKIINYSIRL